MAYLSGLPDFLPSFSIIIGSPLPERSEKVYRENKSGNYLGKGWLGRILFPFYSAGIVFVYPQQFNLAHPEEEDNQPGLILPGPIGDAAAANPVCLSFGGRCQFMQIMLGRRLCRGRQD